MKNKIVYFMQTDLSGLSYKAVIELAAPHTWGAAIVPVVLAAAFSLAFYGKFSAPLFYSLMLTSVLLQCAVNTLNDYVDFIKGVDTLENSDDPTDTSIVYNRLDPRLAFLVGFGFLAAAFAAGLYAVFAAGPELLLFGGAGVLIILLYSFGKNPISHMPIGEPVSGIAMGGVITVACVYAFSGVLDPRVIALSVPIMLSISLIMLTNNVSDIEKDNAGGRTTFPVIIGRPAALRLHAGLTVFCVAAVCVAVATLFRGGVFLLPVFVLLVLYPELRILRSGLLPGARARCMQDSMRIQWRLGFLYALMAVCGTMDYAQRAVPESVRLLLRSLLSLTSGA